MSQQSPKKIVALIISLAAHAALIYYLGQMALDYALPEGTVSSVEVNYEAPQGEQLENVNVGVVKAPEDASVAKEEAKGPEASSSAAVIVPPVAAPSLKEPPKVVEPKVATRPKAIVGALPEKVLPKNESSAATDLGTVPGTESPDAYVAKVPDSQTPAVDPFAEDVDKKNLENVSEVAAEPAAAVVAPSNLAPSPDASEKQVVNEDPASVAPSPAPTSPSAITPETSGAPAVAEAKYGKAEGVLSDVVLSPVSGNKKISYPTMARFRKLEGETVVHYTVGGDGAVKDVQLIKSSGHDVLDDSVMETIRNWKFKPTGREGVYERPVQFSLKGDAVAAPSQLRRVAPKK